MNENTEIKTSTIVDESVQIPQSDYIFMPTWTAIAILIFVFFVTKTFIYIKDDKRHGK
jgi:heme/copper-type cytochrome/quinol oxidase subunit 2